MINNYEIDLGLKQIKQYDDRWYEVPNGKKYPSVTTILNAKSKGYALEKWMRSLGMNYESIMDGYMTSGSKVHKACENLQRGEVVSFLDLDGEELYKFNEEWKKILTFKDWYESNNVESILIEQQVYSDIVGYAGTMDMLCKIDGEVWVIDIKSGGNINTGYKMQSAAYFKAIHELKEFEVKPTKAGILTLDNPTKKKWRLTEVDNIDYMFDCFKSVKKIWELDNPNFEMIEKTYPIEIQLKGVKHE